MDKDEREAAIQALKSIGVAGTGLATDLCVPGAGSAASFFATIAMESVEQIRLRFQEREGPLQNEFGYALAFILERSGKSPEDLFAQQSFATFAAEALRIGIRKHRRETLVRLRVAIISAALSEDQDEDRQLQFLRLVDEMSERHILLLGSLCDQVKGRIGFIDPNDGARRSETTIHTTPSTSLQQCYEALPRDLRDEVSRFTFRVLMSDLSRHFLVHMADAEDLEEFHSGNSGLLIETSEPKPIAVTTHGVRFLRFVRGDDVEMEPATGDGAEE